MNLLELFWSFFQVGLFSIGGGLAALPLIQEQIVTQHGWLTLTEFTDLVTIAEMTPGPIAINAATFVGIRIGGLAGAVVATAGCVLPSVIIVSLLAWVYFRYQDLAVVQGILGGIRPAVVALIASAGTTILTLAFWGERGLSAGLGAVNPVAVALFLGALLALRRWKISPILAIFGTGLVGGLIYLLV